jgi:hypothetical protein
MQRASVFDSTMAPVGPDLGTGFVYHSTAA